MTTLSIGPVRRWRRLAGLFAVLLAIASAVPAHAGSAGIVNGSFGELGNCNLNNWTGTGAFIPTVTSFRTDGERTCAGRISSLSNGAAEASVGDKGVFAAAPSDPGTQSTVTTSTLRQRFLVSATDKILTLYVQPESDRPGTNYPAQTIALYSSSGLIYQKSRNVNLTPGSEGYQFYLFSYDLSAYANQYVTLVLQTSTDSELLDSPSVVRLTVDFDCPVTIGCGSAHPGGVPPTDF